MRISVTKPKKKKSVYKGKYAQQQKMKKERKLSPRLQKIREKQEAIRKSNLEMQRKFKRREVGAISTKGGITREVPTTTEKIKVEDMSQSQYSAFKEREAAKLNRLRVIEGLKKMMPEKEEKKTGAETIKKVFEAGEKTLFPEKPSIEEETAKEAAMKELREGPIKGFKKTWEGLGKMGPTTDILTAAAPIGPAKVKAGAKVGRGISKAGAHEFDKLHAHIREVGETIKAGEKFSDFPIRIGKKTMKQLRKWSKAGEMTEARITQALPGATVKDIKRAGAIFKNLKLTEAMKEIQKMPTWFGRNAKAVKIAGISVGAGTFTFGTGTAMWYAADNMGFYASFGARESMENVKWGYSTKEEGLEKIEYWSEINKKARWGIVGAMLNVGLIIPGLFFLWGNNKAQVRIEEARDFVINFEEGEKGITEEELEREPYL